MSYAGPVSRGKRVPDAESTAAGASRTDVVKRRQAITARSASSDRGQATVFAAGLALGIALGAGVALLLAPGSGADTRRALLRRSQRVGRRGRDAWDDLRDELRNAVRDRRRAWRRRRQLRQDAKADE